MRDTTSPSPSSPELEHPGPRPTLLGILTILGILGSLLLVVGSILPILMTNRDTWNEFPNFLLGVSGLILNVGLRKGRYWAWVFMQLIYIINIIICLFGEERFNVISISGIVGSILLFIYFHSKGVKRFCIVGKKSEIKETA